MPPYRAICRGGRPCLPGPGSAAFCRAGPMCPAAYGAPQIETERFLVGEARAFPASLNTKGIIFHGKEENRRKINARMETEILTTKESPKDKLLKEILKKENISDEDTDFNTAKEKYRQSVNERMQRLFGSK